MIEPADDIPDLLAAEWALGLLDADELRAAEARRARDPAFDAACRRWEHWASGLLDDGDVAPGAELWDRINAGLPANDDGRLADLRRSVSRWRGIAAGLAVIAIALGSGLAADRLRQPPPSVAARLAPVAQPIVVILTSADRQAIVSISFDKASGRFAVADDAFHTGRRSAELWVIPSDQVPRSLGLLFGPDRNRIAPGDAAARILPGATLAVSLEPLGGSKTGKPTGPVVLTGKV